MVSIKVAKKFHRNKKAIPRIVRKQVRKNKSILTGGHALNAHLPPFLDKPTEDFDIFTDKPRKRARELERKLDKKFDADIFFVKPARFKGTFKVMNRVTEKEVADFSKRKPEVTFVKKGETRVASISFLESKFRESLRDPESRFRHAKDRDSLRRLQILRSLK